MLSIMKTSIYLAETAVSDMFLVSLSKRFFLARRLTGSRHQLYRCYVVWNSSTLIMAFPVLLYVADMGMSPDFVPSADVHSMHLPPSQAMGIGAVYTLSLVGTSTFFNNEQQRFTNSFFSCTLALNAICTGACLCLSSDISFPYRASSGLIAFQIWRTQRQTRDAKMGSNLSHVAVIIVESGTFHSSAFSTTAAILHVPECNRCNLFQCVSMWGRNLCYQVVPLQYRLGYRESYQLLPSLIPADILSRRPRL